MYKTIRVISEDAPVMIDVFQLNDVLTSDKEQYVALRAEFINECRDDLYIIWKNFLVSRVLKKVKENNPEAAKPLEELGFSTRTVNCLKVMDIDCGADLLTRSKDDFRNTRGLGRKGFEEIVAVMERLFPVE